LTVLEVARRNPYENADLLRWLDSYEGLPDVADVAESRAEEAARRGLRARANEIFGMAGTVLPGVVLAGALALAGSALADWLGTAVLGFEKSPVSPIGVAIVLGLLIRNGVGLPVVYEAGLRLCVKRVLRVGVALLGLRLSLAAAGALGLAALPIVVASIATALVVVTWISRALGLPGRLGWLVAVGTSVCGNTAVVATGPVIDAEDDEVSYAVACVTLFGLLALLVYPPLAHALFDGDARQVGLFLGTAIHDTAQVAGAGLLYAQQYGAPEALDVAAVTKLVRNLFMLAVIPLVALLYRRGERRGRALGGTPFTQIVPLFVFAFVALTALRSLGDLGERPLGLLDRATWDAGIARAGELSTWCLAFAMAAVGLGTSFTKLRVLGARPLLVGLSAALLVGAVSFALVRWTAGA
jgi:uncharacterized integral membrane protein (TIGR00698 family)